MMDVKRQSQVELLATERRLPLLAGDYFQPQPRLPHWIGCPTVGWRSPPTAGCVWPCLLGTRLELRAVSFLKISSELLSFRRPDLL